MNLKNVTKLRIEHPDRIGIGRTRVTLRTGSEPGITGRNYEVVSDGKGSVELSVRNDVTVTFPEENILENADILIKKGDVTVSDFHGLKTLRVSGTYCDTELRDITVEKKITLESMEGLSTVKDAESGKLVLSSMAGDFRVDADIDRIEAETISGDLMVAARDSGSIELSTVAGSMTVKTDTVPAVEFEGIRDNYTGPESDSSSDLKIRVSSINGSLDVKTA